MNRARRRTRPVVMLVAGIAGFALAALTGLALAKSFTLEVGKHAKVTNVSGVTKHENIVTDKHQVAVYTLTHDTIKSPGCTLANGCFNFWFPVTVGKHEKLTMAPGVKGKLGTFARNGFIQLTLNKHPLYTFKGDRPHKDLATGEGIPSFGGTWHVLLPAASNRNTNTGTTTTMTTTTMTTTTTTTCTTPPYCYP